MSIPPNLPYAGATFKSTGSTTPRSHGDRAVDRINVKDFGAKGDHSDDRAAIQMAIDAAFGGPTNPIPGGSLVPHGYTNRHLNRALYFPATSTGGYWVTDSLQLNHIYGGLIYGDVVFLSVPGSSLMAGSSNTAPVFAINGMVETFIENLGFYSPSGSPCNVDLDWDGTWADLPVAGQGLRHNVFSNVLGGTAQIGIRVGHSNNDGSFNTFQRVLIGTIGTSGIDIQGTSALGNQVYGGAVSGGLSGQIGYRASGGQFSVIMGIGQGGTSNSVRIDTPYPCAIIGGRMETGGICIEMSAGLVGVRGFNFQDGATTLVHATGGKISFDGCFAAPVEFGGAFITGTAPATLYIRGCSFGAVNLSGFTGTIAENI